jgi:uncharacterized protein YecT (DUF1311 family)
MQKSISIALMTISCSTVSAEVDLSCVDPINTLMVNHCATNELKVAKAELAHYLQASLEHNSNDPALLKSIKKAQQDWQIYATSHCDSIYTQWREGTIRGAMTINCQTQLNKHRTHELWANFLTYMDSTPPVLPEPEK